MTAETICEPSAYYLVYHDYDTSESRDISWDELKRSRVGDTFVVDIDSNCGRAVREEEGKVVYKDDEGCALLVSCHRTSDTPEARDLGTDRKLIWFQFKG